MPDVAAIADSGPLICLAKINQLKLLPQLFSKILVPPAVWSEVTIRGKDHSDAYEISRTTWLIIQTPDPHLVKSLSILVDAGEAEAIALAQTTADCTLLLDDSRARRIAKQLNISHIGTIGLMLRAKRRGLIENLRFHIEALVENGIFISKTLIDAVIKEAGEE